jgi:hypothetical protein
MEEERRAIRFPALRPMPLLGEFDRVARQRQLAGEAEGWARAIRIHGHSLTAGSRGQVNEM